MKKNKIWKIKGYEGSFTDEELIGMISSGQVKKDFAITTKEMKKWVKVSDSIYQFYLKEDGHENL
ncbi:MAG: DUF4339 domain-containing protein [Erysipelotrichaceae bacterium]|nr:DUF4339 domain-containing protein [Erysipelotrichaceae bacterium]